MARDSSSRGVFGAAWIGAGAALVAALIGAAAIIWQTVYNQPDRPTPTPSRATQALTAPASPGCSPRTTSEITLSPPHGRTGETIVISGSGFPGAAKVYLEAWGDAPNFGKRLGHMMTPALDSCGTFSRPWSIPPSWEQTSGTSIRINATGQDATGSDIGVGTNDANAEFTLVR